MFKAQVSLAHDIRPTRPKRTLRWTLFIMAGVLCCPLVLEAAVCCYGQWCEVIGKSVEVSTPITDTFVKGLGNVHEWLGEEIAPSFHRLFREPKLALPVSVMLIVIGIAMLRR
jgi:hypothetical protein